MKIKWRVYPKPTGPYRSFAKRGWPSAEFEDGSSAATLSAEEPYIPALSESSWLTIRVFHYAGQSKEKGLPTHRLTKQVFGLKAAKRHAEQFIRSHPEYRPQ